MTIAADCLPRLQSNAAIRLSKAASCCKCDRQVATAVPVQAAWLVGCFAHYTVDEPEPPHHSADCCAVPPYNFLHSLHLSSFIVVAGDVSLSLGLPTG